MTPRLVSTRTGWHAVAVCAAFAGGACFAVVVHAPLLVAAALALVCSGLGAALRAVRLQGATLMVLLGLCAAAGLARGAMAAPSGAAWVGAVHGGPVVMVGTVRDGTGSRRSAGQVVVDVERLVHADGDQEVRGAVLASLRAGPVLWPGDHVRLDATGLRPPRGSGAESLLPAEGVVAVAQSPAVTLESSGGMSPARALAGLRSRLVSIVDGALPPPLAELLDGIVFGIHRPLPADLSGALRDSGLAHLLAVSGLKVAVVAGMLAAACAALAVSPRSRIFLTAGAVGAYVVVAGGGAAAVRSALMAAAGWGLHGTGHSIDPLPLLAVVAAVMLAVDPGLCRDVGFQLSFLGTLGILVLAGRIAERLPGPRLLREPFAVTVAAQVATVPVMASTFGVLSTVAPFANALAVPLLPPLILLGAGGSLLSFASPVVGSPPLQVAGLICALISAIARRSASLPLAAVHVAGWPRVLVVAELVALAAAAVTWRGVAVMRRGAIAGHSSTTAVTRHDGGTLGPARPPWSRRTAAAVAACVALVAGGGSLVLAARPDGHLHVAVLDAGAGRAVAIQTAAGGRALVDAGADAPHLVDALSAELPPLTRDLGLLVLTGGERSATGGLAELAAHYGFDRAVVPDGDMGGATRTGLAALAAKGTAVERAPVGAAWTWEGATWRLLGIPGVTPVESALEVADGRCRLLLLGGLPVDSQEELVAVAGGRLDADLLVAPPSGLLAPALLDAARPHYIAIPGGGSTRSSAPRLIDGPQVRRTADSGTLTYAGGDGGLTPT